MSDTAIRITDNDGVTSEAGIFWDKVFLVTDRLNGRSTYLAPADARALGAALIAIAGQLDAQQAEYDAAGERLAVLRGELEGAGSQ